MYRDGDTIFALSSGFGRAGVAVIRGSGPDSANIVETLSGVPLPKPREARLRTLRSPGTGEHLDRGLVIWFPSPGSYTGEDAFELHVHGGPAVVDGILNSMQQETPARPAEPGEFTRRAFLNGRMDLTRAEGVADLIDAETAAQRRQALAQASGGLEAVYLDWLARLARALAWMETAIDFADEDLPDELETQVRPDILRVSEEIQQHLDDNGRGERLRNGFSVVIAGPPNAGKSSLINALAGRDAAIVSDQAGTTRDVIEVHLDLAGYPVRLADTAGLREAKEDIEAEGIKRAVSSMKQADLVLAVVPATDWPVVDPSVAGELSDGDIVFWNKADLAPDAVDDPGAIAGSAKTGAGLDELVERLGQAAESALGGRTAPALTRSRHRHALEACNTNLERYIEGNSEMAAELAAEDVRLAIRSLGTLTGRVDVEDLLDIVFRDFCIGK